MNPKQTAKQKVMLTIAYNNYQKGLKARALFKVSDALISEDLVQETFIKTWRYLVKGGKIDIMKAFLYHILNNLIVDEYRKRKALSLDLLNEKGLQLSVDHTDRLFSILDGKAAVLLIQSLPEKYKKIMYMRYVQNLSTDDMALLTGLSKNAIAVQAHRGLEKLKALYNHQA